MVGSVNTNINALAAVATLTAIGNQLTATQGQIQSGLAVGTASDNPAVFTIAQGLRGNINALSAVSNSLSTGTATVQAQTQGATAISNALTTLLQTVTQAQGQTGDALAASNATITNALANIDAYANATTINSVNLLSTAGTLNVLSNVDGTNTSVTTTNASTSDGLGLTGLAVTTGSAVLTQGTAGPLTKDTFTYTDTRGNSTIFEFNDGTNALQSTPVTGTIVNGKTYNATNVVNVNVASTSAASYGNLLTALQANGVAATENQAGQITVSGGGSVAAAAVPGVSAATTTIPAFVAGSGNTASGATVAVASVSSGASAIAAVNSAIAKVGRTLSALGAATIQLQGLTSFTSNLSSSVQTGLGAIVDANLSAESAQLSSLQTKQSLAIQSLSLANQGPSALLQLFR